MRNVSLDRQNTIVAMSQCRRTLCRQIWPTVYFVPLVSIRILNSLKFSTKRPRLFTQTDQAAWSSGHVPHFLELRALNLHRDTDHPNWGLSWLFSASRQLEGYCRGYGTAACEIWSLRSLISEKWGFFSKIHTDSSSYYSSETSEKSIILHGVITSSVEAWKPTKNTYSVLSCLQVSLTEDQQ